MTTGVPLVEVTRTDRRRDLEVVESVHTGHVVVVDGDGRVVAAAGDPARPTYHRSSVKPFQTVASLEILGDAAADLTPEEVAVAWASHTAEDVHLATVRRLLDRAGLAEDDLTCPPATREAVPGSDERRLHYNCSGKHALFGWAGHVLGLPRDRRLVPDAALQARVLAVVQEAVGDVDGWAVDGCGAPAVLGPLVGLARGYAALRREDRWARVVDAGLTAPVLVGGTDRAETALLAAGVVAKPGAEGVFALAFDTPSGPRAAAVKIDDGAARAAATVAVALVAALGGPTVTWSHPVLGGGAPEGTCRAVGLSSLVDGAI